MTGFWIYSLVCFVYIPSIYGFESRYLFFPNISNLGLLGEGFQRVDPIIFVNNFLIFGLKTSINGAKIFLKGSHCHNFTKQNRVLVLVFLFFFFFLLTNTIKSSQKSQRSRHHTIMANFFILLPANVDLNWIFSDPRLSIVQCMYFSYYFISLKKFSIISPYVIQYVISYHQSKAIINFSIGHTFKTWKGGQGRVGIIHCLVYNRFFIYVCSWLKWMTVIR